MEISDFLLSCTIDGVYCSHNVLEAVACYGYVHHFNAKEIKNFTGSKEGTAPDGGTSGTIE